MTRSNREASPTPPLESLRRTRDAAERAIRDAESPEVAFRIATDLVNAFREASDAMAGIRAREAARIRDSEGLSLAELAARLDISKPRADQLIRAAKAQDANGDR